MGSEGPSEGDPELVFGGQPTTAASKLLLGASDSAEDSDSDASRFLLLATMHSIAVKHRQLFPLREQK